MVTEAKWKRWQPADLHRYIHIALDCFGWSRLMIGSDWPVCTVSGEYGPTMQVVIGYLQQFAPKIRNAILGGNCARFYGIK
jgi:L-fuconolactonase